MAKTTIEWTARKSDDGTQTAGFTWNPPIITGCDQISPGCAHCYAKTLSKRLRAMGNSLYQNEFVLTLHPDQWDAPAMTAPLRRRKPTTYFVNSMYDLWHKDVPVAYIQRVFEIMNAAPHHTFQILTKRHERLAEFADKGLVEWTPNIWQGVSIENNRWVERADALRHVRAQVCFLSCEPLLSALPDLNLDGIGWVIAGGESGVGHRPVNLDHLRQVRDLCIVAGVPFFLKQIGGIRPKVNGKNLDGREWCEMPVLAEAV